MLEKICISIIVPVYNAQLHIEKCINCILRQNFQEPIEIILIDDASKDKSVEFIKKFNLNNLKLYSLPVNSGPSAARNLGIKKAKGEYIFFLDVDDSISDNSLNVLYQVAKSENCNFVCADFKRIENSKNQRENVFNYPSDIKFDNKKIIDAMKKEVSDPTLGHLGLFGCNGRLIKRSIIIDNNILFEEKFLLLEDKTFSWRVLGFVESAIYIRKQLYSYYVYPNVKTQVAGFINRGWPIENFKIIKRNIENSLKRKRVNSDEIKKIADQGFIFHIIQVLVSTSRSILLKKIKKEIAKKFRKNMIIKILEDKEVKIAIQNYTPSNKESIWIPKALSLGYVFLVELACIHRAKEVLKRRRKGNE
jgi:glycosyltransferase involved in cell wall biosynthesis